MIDFQPGKTYIARNGLKYVFVHNFKNGPYPLCFDREGRAYFRTEKGEGHPFGSESPDDIIAEYRPPKLSYLLVVSGGYESARHIDGEYESLPQARKDSDKEHKILELNVTTGESRYVE